MNRHELGEQIALKVLLNPDPHEAVIEKLLQKQPYTAVEVVFVQDGQEYTGIGFAKVKWPDVWDESYGIEMAVKKAAHDIARQICGDIDMVVVPAEGQNVS